jgi:hypothetical protein
MRYSRKDSRSAGESKLERWVKVVAWVAVPIVVALLPALVQKGQLEQKYVEIAVAVLSSTSPDVKPLRGWAVRVVNKLSPVKLSQAEQEALGTGSASLAGTGAVSSTAEATLTGSEDAVEATGIVQGGNSKPSERSTSSDVRKRPQQLVR